MFRFRDDRIRITGRVSRVVEFRSRCGSRSIEIIESGAVTGRRFGGSRGDRSGRRRREVFIVIVTNITARIRSVRVSCIGIRGSRSIFQHHRMQVIIIFIVGRG